MKSALFLAADYWILEMLFITYLSADQKGNLIVCHTEATDLWVCTKRDIRLNESFRGSSRLT